MMIFSFLPFVFMITSVRKDKVQIEIEINGKKVKNTIRDLQKAYSQLNREIQHLTPGTDEFIAKAKEMAEVKRQLDLARASARQFQGEQTLMGKGFAQIKKLAISAFSGLGALVAGIGFSKIIGDLFSLSREIDALDQKAKIVFGEAIGIVEEFAKRNATAMGLTEREYIAAAAAAGDLLIPMGFQREEAAALSADLVNLSGALSEWSGGQYDSSEVSAILTKSLLGEREQLKSLGISILETDVKQRLLEKGQKSLTGTALQQAKAMATLELITEKSGDAQAAYAENTGNLTRQTAILQASLKNIQERVARNLIPAFSKLLSLFVDVSDETTETTSALEKQRTEINLLVARATLLNEESADRAAILKELNERYPGFLQNLNAEKVSNAQLRDRLAEVNEQLINRIILQSKEVEITKQLESAAQARTNALDTESDIIKRLIEIGGISSEYADNATAAIEATEARIQQLGGADFGQPFDQLSKATQQANALQLSLDILISQQQSANDESEKAIDLQKEREKLIQRLGINIAPERGFVATEEAEIKATIDKTEKVKKLEVDAARAIEDLKIAIMAEGIEKELALLELRAARRIEGLAGTPDQVASQETLLLERLEIDKQAIRDKYATAALKKQASDLQSERDQNKSAYDLFLQDLEESKKREILAKTQEAGLSIAGGNNPAVAQEVLNQELLQLDREFLSEKLELQQLFGFSTIETEQAIADAQVRITLGKNEKMVGAEAEKWDKIQQVAGRAAALLGALFSAQTAAIDQEYDQQLDALEKQKEQELTLAGDNSEKREQIELEYSARRTEIEKQAAREKQQIAIKQALIQTALNIIQALPDLALAAFAGAMGIIQLAAIRSQTFAGGGYTGEAPFGISADHTGQKPVGVVHENEWVANRHLVNHPVFGPQIAQMDAIQRKGSPHFASGGFTSNAQPDDLSVQAAGANLSNEALLVEIRALRGALDNMRFVSIWGEREAERNQSITNALNARRQAGAL